MKYSLAAVLLFITVAGQSQNYALRDINYSYLYDPAQPFSFALRVTRSVDVFNSYYKLTWKDTSAHYAVEWEIRKTLGEEKGVPVDEDKIVETKTIGTLTGHATVSGSSSPQVLVARVLHETAKRVWIFYRVLEANYPVQSLVNSSGEEVLSGFVNVNQEVSLQLPEGNGIATYYNDDFPPAAPAFSETQARVAKKMKQDSIFPIVSGQSFKVSKPGLYLFQKDTASSEGIAIRSQDDYPRLSRIESIADPLIYVCTKTEYDKLKAAKGDKKAFDRIILTITNDAERARNFMRSYFRRVELANQYFTSYKEGWKTDRGMIYIVFGMPDEVFKFPEREVWNYKTSTYKGSFTFAKSATIFDPDNFVLIRGKKYQDPWYQVVDLWRNARF